MLDSNICKNIFNVLRWIYIIFFNMWLFDNIFLDKDTPTALLDNPEIKSPDGAPKAEKMEEPYDPKNDPIAPMATTPTDGSSPSTDISFDIGGDIDFSAIGESSPDIETQEIHQTNTMPTTDASPSTDIGSIAMIQWWTASVVDSIDIGGISGIQIEGWDAPTLETASHEENSPASEIHIEIHDISDHEWVADAQGNESGSIYGLMDEQKESEKNMIEIPSIVDVPVVEDVIEEITPVIEPTETAVSSPEKGIELTDLPIFSDITATASVAPGEWRIQEFISKLIVELQKLDKEDARLKAERTEKVNDIAKREEELEKEYTTRKEALKYERAALEMPVDRTSEKEHLKSLIASFEEDLV